MGAASSTGRCGGTALRPQGDGPGDQWPDVLAFARSSGACSLPGPDPVVLHGDLHGYNMVWDGRNLVAVRDFENLAFGDPSFEVRYLPDNAPTQAYVLAVLNALRRAGHHDDPERALAWHVLTRLGDAAPAHFGGGRPSRRRHP